MNKIEEKEKLNNALKEMKIAEDRHKVKEIFKSHIGFEKEKQKFLEESKMIQKTNFPSILLLLSCTINPLHVGKEINFPKHT